MPVNVRRFCTSVFLTLFALAATGISQTPSPSPDPSSQPAAKAPTAADVMRDRIAKAKAFIVVRNYPAAVYELENIRRETNDPSVNAVAGVLLMNSYIEQGDYKRATELLKDHFESYKRNNANAALFYQAVAGQVVKGARSQVERYRTLGLTVSDRNLPLEAVNDIEAMRGLVEMVVEQTKEASADRSKSMASVVMLEEAMATRAAIARDDYDERRWRDAAADTREQIANSQSIVINATDGRPVGQPGVQNTAVAVPAASTSASPASPVAVKVANTDPPQPATPRPDANAIAQAKPAVRSDQPVQIVDSKSAATKPNEPAAPVTEQTATALPAAASATEGSDVPDDGPLEVGSLLGYATSQSTPNYPATARQMRAVGVVRVNVVVDENGEVSEIQSLTGHALLQPAARDAIRRWRFKPFTRDGQPVKATGFVNFNFAL